jgi:hypothetical protein
MESSLSSTLQENYKNCKRSSQKWISDALPLVQMFEAYKSKSKEKFDEAIRSSARLGLPQYQFLLYEEQGLNFLEKDDAGWQNTISHKPSTCIQTGGRLLRRSSSNKNMFTC